MSNHYRLNVRFDLDDKAERRAAEYLDDTNRIRACDSTFLAIIVFVSYFRNVLRRQLRKDELNMRNEKKEFIAGILLLLAFAVWTILIQTVDVQAVGVNGTTIGLASINTWFHKLTGAHMSVYTITDRLGLVPIFICLLFGIWGLIQLIKRRSIFKVDKDIILLGFYYVIVIFAYLIFEMIPINYRPILIDGLMETSYPSSTTLLVLSVMPTLKYQIDRRSNYPALKKAINIFTICFSLFMVIGRLLAGVHWCTDIIGSVLLSMGLFKLYQFSVAITDQKSSE